VADLLIIRHDPSSQQVLSSSNGRIVSTDETVKLFDALTRLLGVLVWPALIGFVIFRFRASVGSFMADLSEFTLKGGGFEASAKRRQAEAAAALGAANATRSSTDETTGHVARAPRATAQIVSELVTPSVIRRAARSVVLWVDERPESNIHERQALEALGISFVLSTSTDDALEKSKQQSFDAIISDMGRPPDPHAGYTLLEKLRTVDNQTPYIIYAGSRSPEHQAESRRRGAVGCTNRPDELFEMVLRALESPARN